MHKALLQFLLLGWVAAVLHASAPIDAPEAEAAPAKAAALEPAPEMKSRKAKAAHVYVIPVREQIGSAVLYVVRRGLKEAIERKADAVILDMKTPGGALDSTLEIMEAISKFEGATLTYVNNEAMSAGAFISATTEEIWFAPSGIIGAAAPVSAGGQDVEATMRQKITSYLRARVRAISEGHGYRGEVISAMIDADYELKIGDKVIKGKGELLSLTASEAAKHYGEPPQPLLSAGTAKGIDELIAQRFGPDRPAVTTLELTWSEQLAVWLNAIAPVLLGIGLLAIYIEFKTPGFGVFGITGIVCLSLVFLGNFVAGFSGHEPMLLFGLGVVLIAIELFFFPGIVVMALTGVMLMLTALIWSMADIWPNEPISIQGDLLVRPLRDLGLGMVIAVVLALALARFIPKGWFFTRLAVTDAARGSAQVAGSAPAVGLSAAGLVGRVGIAVTGLYPGGQIEIDGHRYEARLEVGSAPQGTEVVVRRKTDFGLLVDRREERNA